MNSEKLVIGLVGRMGSGKGTVAGMLVDLAADNGITVQRATFSDLLKDTLVDFGIEPTRENSQQLAIFLHNRKANALGHKMHNLITSTEASISIVDGLRWKEDLELIKSFTNHLIICVTATPEARFERLVSRSEKPGEHKMSFEGFLEAESVATETQIDDIGKLADIEIINTGTLDELRQHLIQLWEGRIIPHLVDLIHHG